MKQECLRIASRRSRLALWQANEVKRQLQQHIDVPIEIITFVTQGDTLLDQPLNKIGGKGLFVKELEQALLDHRADIAVHSSKDLPADFPDGLCLAAVCQRDDPRDAFISNQFAHISKLDHTGVIGTSSLRRQSQLANQYPQLTFCNVRGNVETRLKKLDDGDVSALVLAAAGLRRLSLTKRITHYFEPDECLPAVGQGTLAIECCSDDITVLNWVKLLNDYPSQLCLNAERAFNHHLGGNCYVPVAGYATLTDNNTMLHIEGCVGKPNGDLVLRQTVSGDAKAAVELGVVLAEKLLQQGAQAIIDAC